MKKFKALISSKETTPFWHEFEAFDMNDAKDFINQFCSAHSTTYTQLQQITINKTNIYGIHI